MVAHQRDQAALDLRRLQNLRLVGVYLAKEFTLLVGQRLDARFRSGDPGLSLATSRLTELTAFAPGP
jgi:hypothetical protein